MSIKDEELEITLEENDRINLTKDIKNKMEAIMLLGGDEVKILDLSKYFKLSEEEIINYIRDLKFERRNTGINIEINGDVTYLITNPQYGSAINDYFEYEYRPRKLSEAALETLSIIAYRQPITKRELESIRGKSVDGVVISLEERKFIRVCGRRDGPGRPKLYEITDKFLGYIGVNSIEELPNYTDVKTGNIYEKLKTSSLLTGVNDDINNSDNESEIIKENIDEKNSIEKNSDEESNSFFENKSEMIEAIDKNKKDIEELDEEEYGSSNDSEG